MAIGVIAKLMIQAGKNKEFEQAFLIFENKVNSLEEGNIFFSLHRSRIDNCSYTVLEQYTDQAAFDIHQNTEYYKAIPEIFSDYMAGPPDIEVLDGVA